MKWITLKGTNIETTSLGFGCAGLMRLTSAGARERLLATAFDHGLRHFDVARSYGLGKAERILGDFLRTRRDQLTITTKFGILLNPATTLLSGVQAIGRRVIAFSPALRRAIRRRSGMLYREQAFTAEEARKSLDTSLRELRTDYVDLLLIHECSAESIHHDDLLTFLEEAVRGGRIRSYGTASTFAKTLEICRSLPQYTRLVQFENDIVNGNIGQLPDGEQKATITHGTLATALEAVHRSVISDNRRRAAWSEVVGADCGDRRTLATLLLLHCLRVNPGGIVLFQSTSPANIAANVRALTESRFSEAALDALAARVAAEVPKGSAP